MIPLSQEQAAIVNSTATNIAVAACAGSGKTRVLVERIRKLISDGIAPESICCVTFTTGAAKEIERRLSCKFCNGTGRAECADDQGAVQMVQCEFCHGQRVHLGHSGTLHALCLKAIRSSYQALGYSAPPSVASEEVATKLKDESVTETRTKALAGELEKAFQTDSADRNRTKAQVCAAHYHQKLMAAGLVDYDGILRLGLRLVRMGKFPFKFVWLIVDEAQDSSEMDFNIFEEMPASKRMYVGDFDQQIYGFRGACGQFEEICRDASELGFTLFRLQTCYRCSSEICEAAENVLTFIPDRLAKRTISSRGPKWKPLVQSFVNFPDELAWVACNLADNNGDDSCPYNEAAVLLRTNALANAFRDGLAARGIPVRRQRSAARLPGWQKAQAIIAYQVEPPNDFVALEYAKAVRGDEYAKNVQKRAAVDCCPIVEVVIADGANWVGAGDLNDAIAEMVQCGVPVATIEAIEKLHAESGSLDELLLAMQRPDEDQSGDGVYVGTVHSFKGREANDVYLPGFEDQTFPARRNLSDEVRLAYVAITRARNRLLVSWCEERINSYTKRTEQMQPSRFIQQIERNTK